MAHFSEKLKTISLRALIQFTMRPYRQFKVVIFFSLTLFVVSIITHVYLFNQINAHTLFQGTGTVDVRPQGVNTKKLSEVLDLFAVKEKARQDALGKMPVILNPGELGICKTISFRAIDHKYFSAEKFRDPASRRRALSLKLFPKKF